mgnify:CR=1 FL=1
MYLGLSGARLKVGDSLAAGIATHYLPSSGVEDLVKKLYVGNLAFANNLQYMDGCLLYTSDAADE